MKRLAERCLACRTDTEPGSVFCPACRKGVVREGPAYTRCVACRSRMPVLSPRCFACGARADQIGRRPATADAPPPDELPRSFLVGLCGGGVVALVAVLCYALVL
jgi:hypothetical protein